MSSVFVGVDSSFQRSTVKLFPDRIFVGGMSRETNEEDLFQLFSNYGEVKSTKIITDTEGSSKGYGFVTFATEEEAQKIQLAALDLTLHNRKLNIGPAMKKNLILNNDNKAQSTPDYSTILPFLATSTADSVLPQQFLPYYGLPFNMPYGFPYQTHHGFSFHIPFP